MASVPHHQAQAQRFLALARADYHAGDYDRAANALARSASHAATAALFHWDFLPKATRRRLTNWLFVLAHRGQISYGCVRTFRQIYELPDRLAAADPGSARRLTRRAVNRVSTMLRQIEGAIAGRPRVAPRRQRRPRPQLNSIRDILALPDFKTIAAIHGLTRDPLAMRPDPHGMYSQGRTPIPCPCHPEPLDLCEEFPQTVTLSPLWRKALEKTFRMKIPAALPY